MPRTANDVTKLVQVDKELRESARLLEKHLATRATLEKSRQIDFAGKGI